MGRFGSQTAPFMANGFCQYQGKKTEAGPEADWLAKADQIVCFSRRI